MIYLAIDKGGEELLSTVRLKRSNNTGWVYDMRYCYPVEDNITVLPKGFIKKVIGRNLTWDDDPVEVTNENLDMFPTKEEEDKYKVFHFEHPHYGRSYDVGILLDMI